MITANGPAFAQADYVTQRANDGYYDYTGLTKREYFAAMAMQGLASRPDFIAITETAKHLNMTIESVVASVAVSFADELIKRLNKD